ncbi:recombinase family protein [Saccharococcus sp. Marseille-Q5394]|uniref:recombinase family protein n=1 Tax=Saccharococcus sp. Marseille-Q5394 TaxID=2972778 RepID=UPI0021C8741A|nr:recombinase family protein [Saccharococcus sp. Marseille-Q5394]
MTKYGYARVSSISQDLDIQIEQLKKEGCDIIYSEKFTGMSSDRPEFIKLLEVLKEGDTLTVTKLDRFARSAEDGVSLIQDLLAKGINVHILNMGLVEDTPMGRLILRMMLAFAEFDRDMVVERLAEGKEAARQNPNFREGRKPTYTKKQIDHALGLLDKNYSYTQVVDLTGISKSTLARARRKQRAEGRA